MAYTRRPQRSTMEAWPGYVDVLSTLLMVIVFVLVVFVLAQFFLAQALSGKDKALDALTAQVAQLTDLLAMEKQQTAELKLSIAQLATQLDDVTRSRDESRNTIIMLQNNLQAATDALMARTQALTDAEGKLTSNAAELENEKNLSAQARSQVDLLNQQLLALREQLARLSKALDVSEARDKENQAQIVDLGKRLNLALAQKVEELARYRSEFFGRLREVLGNRKDVTIVGDRFVFQSEVLFPSGSADLNDQGRAQMAQLARTLLEIARKIPTQLKWVLRVDGHTDRVPIRTVQFPSNWELSAARAIAVTKFLVSQGVPADRLAATGFGEFQPLDEGAGDEALRRNRRIELKLTER